jgi:PAS domain S-box-containing protein
MQSRVADTADVLATLLQASPDAIVAVDANGLIVLASASIKALFGFDPDEVVGLPVEMLVPEQVRAMHERHRKKYAGIGEARPMGRGLELTGRRRNGSMFAIDVSLAPFSIGGEKFVGAFVRDASDRRRHEARLHAINEITQRLLAGDPTARTLELVACRARGLVDAVLGWVVVPSGKESLVVSASDGEGAASILGLEITSEGSFAKRAMTEGDPIIVGDLSIETSVPAQMKALGLGPGLFCPLRNEERILGALVVARLSEAPGFNESDTALVKVFANAAMVALTIGEARVELEQLQATADRERIGRDLHDTVIQQLFALGMGLQSIERLTSGSVAGRIDRVVDGLDEVIRQIRETIFVLERPALADWGLRSSVNAVVIAASEHLGFTPRVGFQGPVDSVTSEQLEPHVIAVLTEVLSNVARHASASSVEVVIVAEDNMLLVSVADNGVGPPRGRSAGNGLRNIAERARALSGSVSITARSPSGTLVEWSVPITP